MTDDFRFGVVAGNEELGSTDRSIRNGVTIFSDDIPVMLEGPRSLAAAGSAVHAIHSDVVSRF